MRSTDFARPLLSVALTMAAIIAAAASASAQPAGSASTLQVVIERTPFTIRDPATYDIPLKLEPVRQVTLVATVDGLVMPLRLQVGDRYSSQTELVRLDGRLRQLEVERAQAALQAALDEQQKGGAPARVMIAQKDLEIAQLLLEQTVIRMPWDGHLLQVHVSEGQFVRAGDPLVTVADQSRLVAEVPIDRRSLKVGDAVPLKVEETAVEGKLAAILPLPARFDPLRGLFQSVATGRVEIDNAQGQLLAGQTVYSPLIPRLPVGEAPNAAIINSEDGGRRVQVIRDGVIRDVPVQLLGQIGDDYQWISGRFGSHDELVLRTSEPLPDGTQVTQRGAGEAAASGTSAGPRPSQPAASSPKPPTAPPSF